MCLFSLDLILFAKLFPLQYLPSVSSKADFANVKCENCPHHLHNMFKTNRMFLTVVLWTAEWRRWQYFQTHIISYKQTNTLPWCVVLFGTLSYAHLDVEWKHRLCLNSKCSQLKLSVQLVFVLRVSVLNISKSCTSLFTILCFFTFCCTTGD